MKILEKQNHSHTVSNPKSNRTDPAQDQYGKWHTHKIKNDCATCERIRKKLGLSPTTTFNSGHRHEIKE